MSMDTAAIICLAGRSSRMGSYKSLMPFAGTTVISHLVSVFRSAGIEHIVLVTGRDASSVEQEMEGSDVHLVHNPDFESTDMFASVKIGLEAAQEQAGGFFITPGDAVLFAPETVSAMMKERKLTKKDVVVPTFANQKGHPVLISPSVRNSAMAYSGENGLRGVLAGFEDSTSLLEINDFGVLFDMDYPEDYEQVKRLDEGRREGRFRETDIAMAKTALRAAVMLDEASIKVNRRAVITSALFNQTERISSAEAIVWEKRLKNKGLSPHELEQCLEQMTGGNIQNFIG